MIILHESQTGHPLLLIFRCTQYKHSLFFFNNILILSCSRQVVSYPPPVNLVIHALHTWLLAPQAPGADTISLMIALIQMIFQLFLCNTVLPKVVWFLGKQLFNSCIDSFYFTGMFVSQYDCHLPLYLYCTQANKLLDVTTYYHYQKLKLD